MKGDNEKEVFLFFQKKKLQERKGEKGTFLLPLHKTPTKKNKKTKERERKEPIFSFSSSRATSSQTNQTKNKGRGVGRMGLVLGGVGGEGVGKNPNERTEFFLFWTEWGFFLRANPRIDQMGLVHWWVLGHNSHGE
jgi:hypothetical protein